MADTNKTVTLLAGGDIGPMHKTTEEKISEFILPALRQADLRFAQCERLYSNRGWCEFPRKAEGQSSRLPPDRASIWEMTNIEVMSVASNHCMDWGPEAMLDTVDLFR